MDVEVGFIEDHRTLMELLREVLAGIFASIRRRASASSLETLGLELPVVPEVIPAIDFSEVDTGGEPDLSPRARARPGRVGEGGAR